MSNRVLPEMFPIILLDVVMFCVHQAWPCPVKLTCHGPGFQVKKIFFSICLLDTICNDRVDLALLIFKFYNTVTYWNLLIQQKVKYLSDLCKTLY